ncbi:MAG: hypothetical protein M1834_007007 [Cirrosporium novae-zelandiae]|nr:MAG: hypothetical protein M1834_007007 [Cirrosporium novae-zelandiae]
MDTPIRYQVIYKDDDEKLVKGPYSHTNPGVKEDSDASNDSLAPTSVLDLIIHVTIQDIVETKAINTEVDAAKASAATEKKEVDVEDVTAAPTKNSFKIRKVNFSVMVIRSQALIDALRAVVTYYPKQAITGDKITVNEPYYFILHHMKDLEKYVGDTEEANVVVNGDVNRDVKCDLSNGVPEKKDASPLQHDFQVLKSFIDTRWAKKIKREPERHRQDPPVVTYEMLLMLFKPGTRVFVRDDDEEDQVGGHYLSQAKRKFWVEKFDGEHEISLLYVYPVDLLIDGKNVPLNPKAPERLEKRGEKYWGFVQEIFKKGSVQVNHSGEIIGETKLKYYNGNAILDPKAYFSSSNALEPRWLFDNDRRFATKTNNPLIEEKGMWDDYKFITAESTESHEAELGKGHFFLCPATIGGFIIRRREFSAMRIDNINPHSIDENILKNLQIPQEHLDMITALTHKYDDKGKTWSADFIASKGEGLIFLLHGPSGVGKAYTAECIATYTGKPYDSPKEPVLNIPRSPSSGSNCTNESEMKKELAKWFNLSETWGAIMLIDEADVYFERRASGQLQRNSLVSVFLRSMEYYRGILYLTPMIGATAVSTSTDMSAAFKKYMKDFKGDEDRRAFVEGSRMDDGMKRKKDQLDTAKKIARQSRQQL